MAQKTVTGKAVSDAKETKVSEVKEELKNVVKEAEAKVETAAEKVEDAVKTVKKTGRKAAADTKAKAKKEPVKADIIVQFKERETSIQSLEEKVKAQFVAEGHRAGCIKSLNIYIKPEDYKAYYVINEKFSGSVDLF